MVFNLHPPRVPIRGGLRARWGVRRRVPSMNASIAGVPLSGLRDKDNVSPTEASEVWYFRKFGKTFFSRVFQFSRQTHFQTPRIVTSLVTPPDTATVRRCNRAPHRRRGRFRRRIHRSRRCRRHRHHHHHCTAPPPSPPPPPTAAAATLASSLPPPLPLPTPPRLCRHHNHHHHCPSLSRHSPAPSAAFTVHRP